MNLDTLREMHSFMRDNGIIHARMGELELNLLPPESASPMDESAIPPEPIYADDYTAALGGRVPKFRDA